MSVEIEIGLKSESCISIEEMQELFNRFVDGNQEMLMSIISCNMNMNLENRILQMVPFPNSEYIDSIDEIRIKGTKVPISVHCYILHRDESAEDIIDNDGEILSISTQTILPSIKFINDWDSIIFDQNEENIKTTLLKFMETSVLFAENQVCPEIVTSNRILLLYGPPGTGKTTICHGLAQKLSILYSNRFSYGIILEVNTHSLFSKWFAESGKMVKKLFSRLHEIADDSSALVFVLIDEVESLATARQSSMNGSDPSDAIRVVNALLTQLDQLRKRSNVVVMATSNLTECIDFAFLSRADIKQYIGPPSKPARYMILKSCIDELVGKQIIEPIYELLDYEHMSAMSDNLLQTTFPKTWQLLNSCILCDGLCGRILRRLPFLAFVYRKLSIPASFDDFIDALNYAISKQEITKYIDQKSSSEESEKSSND